MSEHESIEQAVRRAERATNGSIAMMIEAGIKAGIAHAMRWPEMAGQSFYERMQADGRRAGWVPPNEQDKAEHKSNYDVPCATCGSMTDDHDAVAHDRVSGSGECVHHNAAVPECPGTGTFRPLPCGRDRDHEAHPLGIPPCCDAAPGQPHTGDCTADLAHAGLALPCDVENGRPCTIDTHNAG